MSMKQIDLLLQFHRAFELGENVAGEPGRPGITPEEREVVRATRSMLGQLAYALHQEAKDTQKGTSGVLLRLQLMVEELGEVADALERDDTEQLLHELQDLKYVTLGSEVEWGFADVSEAAFNRIHLANMSKLVDGKPLRDEAGRVVKPPGFVKATMKGLV